MKVRTIAFVILCFAVLGLCLEGRPVRQWLDDATEHPPSRYGYEVSRKDLDGQWQFTVVIAPYSAKALEKVTLQLVGKSSTVLPLPATDANGRKQLEFTIANENLKGAWLDLDSGPVKYCGPSATDNFMGFRLNLESAALVFVSADDVRVFARKKDASFEFRLVLPQPRLEISRAGPPPPAILSATLIGPVEGGTMTIPFHTRSMVGMMPSEDPVMTLPAAALENFVVRVVYGHYDTPLKLSKTTTRHLGLGIAAANAEAGIQGPAPVEQPMK